MTFVKNPPVTKVMNSKLRTTFYLEPKFTYNLNFPSFFFGGGGGILNDFLPWAQIYLKLSFPYFQEGDYFERHFTLIPNFPETQILISGVVGWRDQAVYP